MMKRLLLHALLASTLVFIGSKPARSGLIGPNSGISGIAFGANLGYSRAEHDMTHCPKSCWSDWDLSWSLGWGSQIFGSPLFFGTEYNGNIVRWKNDSFFPPQSEAQNKPVIDSSYCVIGRFGLVLGESFMPYIGWGGCYAKLSNTPGTNASGRVDSSQGGILSMLGLFQGYYTGTLWRVGLDIICAPGIVCGVFGEQASLIDPVTLVHNAVNLVNNPTNAANSNQKTTLNITRIMVTAKFTL